jgi:hypothetical protein
MRVNTDDDARSGSESDRSDCLSRLASAGVAGNIVLGDTWWFASSGLVDWVNEFMAANCGSDDLARRLEATRFGWISFRDFDRADQLLMLDLIEHRAD